MLAKYAVEQTVRLLAIDSPTGYTRGATDEIIRILTELGYTPSYTRKGCVVCPIGGKGEPRVLSAHADTLGLMVREIKSDGHLAFTRIGGPSFQAIETENVTVVTRDGKRYTGVVQLVNASTHVNKELDTSKRDEDTMEILLDEEVEDEQGVKALGISVGDYACLDPRTRVTPSGFIRSRFLDDKLSAGILLGVAKAVSDGDWKLAHQTTLFFSVYEEVGHGASAGIPEDTEEMLVVDMGCVGKGISCKETQVSICAKDSAGPYDYEMTTRLISLAKQCEIDYAVDVYPRYSSDAATALRSGCDIRFALIGPGVYASHGYERSHCKAVEGTLTLLERYLAEQEQ